jgi:DUF4097 and DUF4098 domain-containing protein YvlB
MTDRVVNFDVDGPPRIEVSLAAGDVVVTSGQPGRVTVELSGNPETVEGAAIDATADLVSVRSTSQKRNRRLFSKRMDVTVRAPDGASLVVGLGSGDIRIRIAAQDVDVSSGRGDIRIENPARDVRVKVASGDVHVASVERELITSSASGDIRADRAMDATVKTASGSVILGRIDGFAHVKTASGDVRVRDFRGPDLEISTMSGDVIAGLAPGRTVTATIKTLSGDLRNKIQPADGGKTGSMMLNITSFSGDVTLTAAK